MRQPPKSHSARTSFIRPETLEQSKQGQAFNHVLASGRDWSQALDSVHYLLLRKWYYLGIATLEGSKSQVMGMQRKRKSLPEEMQSLLKLKMQSLIRLKQKIKEKQLSGEQDRDVWHFTAAWEEFPKGAKVIEMAQESSTGLIKTTAPTRFAYIILDGAAGALEVNTAMKLVHKVIKDKEYCVRLLQEVERILREKGPKALEPKITKAPDFVDARKPGTLLLLLRDDPKQVASASLGELVLLKDYLARLKEAGQYGSSHKTVESLLTFRLKEVQIATGAREPLVLKRP